MGVLFFSSPLPSKSPDRIDNAVRTFDHQMDDGEDFEQRRRSLRRMYQICMNFSFSSSPPNPRWRLGSPSWTRRTGAQFHAAGIQEVFSPKHDEEHQPPVVFSHARDPRTPHQQNEVISSRVSSRLLLARAASPSLQQTAPVSAHSSAWCQWKLELESSFPNGILAASTSGAP
ncbi:uncharacterized protein BJX67DRAFT_247672 [Aspergillus lucknowensis]|uniref:Uncharacterized protein n=1 Tax=Aspergillus lucknowensis TaxID=176173 RepID=A0ABR4M2D6_9EURO